MDFLNKYKRHWIERSIVDITLQYYDFDGEICEGILQVNKNIEDQTREVFQRLFDIKFPINKISPSFGRSDRDIIIANHTTSYNFRTVLGKNTLSNHAYGVAIDLNPKNNPASPSKMSEIYDESIEQGKITPEIIKIFKDEGFEWGGEIFGNFKDNHHFEI